MASVLAELRALAPHRPLAPAEARVVAERQAGRLLRMEKIAEPPVPEQVIEWIPRIRVFYRRRGRGFSGAAKWLDGRWAIVVNASDTWGRQRFSLAHEFKHVLDGPTEQLLYRDRSWLAARAQRERAADCFAAALLMPRPLIKRAFYDEGLRDEYALARRFQVSVSAMRWRLDELCLFEPAEVAA